MQGGLLHKSHSILLVFNPILCHLSPKILIFQELLIIKSGKKCHWIWHALNPKYVPLKPFQCIFPSQNQQNVKVLPEFFIFHEPLIIETQNLYHWIWHITNPKYMPLKSFWCIFPSQNLQNVKFMPVYWTPPNTKWKKILIWTGKKCSKWLENLHRQVFRYANHNALYRNFVWQVLFQLWRFFWIFDKKV